MTSSEKTRPEAAAAAGAGAAGAVCTQPGCASPGGVLCAYTDRRRRRCPTAWCLDHRLLIDGLSYCRRHAGVVSALPRGYSGRAAPLPDLDNRAPSLVSWVAREVDADVRQLLLAELPVAEGSELVTDPVYLVFHGPERRRAWERAWKLIDRAGHSLRVSLLVEERDDAQVAVRVNSQLVDRGSPPWIVDRRAGVEAPPEVDAQRRKEFNRRLCDMIRTGIRRAWTDSPPS